MNIHYNAFISYRHHPDDIRVAAEIHRSLERFHVPRSIRAKYGKINRLFRDKEELPITSDLNDDINEALKNSDYLIVICSVHTKESIWVQREIELFLTTHPRSKVLTVLASGEPYDVIPDILLHDQVVDPVTGELRQIDIEPLSCDWRGKRRKAIQEELPRLAAPLLGCAYDELRQRQKQYRTRRNTAIITSALVASFSLTAYFLYTSITIQKANVQIQQQNRQIQAANVRIQENLDEALINQSRHLATAAEERLAEGDRLTAISLASAALPGKNNVRPYVPEAERVLAEAMGVYRTASETEAVGTVTPGVNILVNRFCVSDSETVLYLHDRRNIITAWDAVTLQKTGSIVVDNAPDDMFALSNGNLIVHGGLGAHTVCCYRPDGTLLWQLSDCPDVIRLPEQNAVLLIHKTGNGSYVLLSVNADTGERIGEALDISLEDSTMMASAFAAAPNSGIALVRYYQSYGSPQPFYAYDLNTGEKWLLDPEVFPVTSTITDDGMLVYMGEKVSMGLAGLVEGSRIMEQATRQICCYNLRTGGLLWKSAITSPASATASAIHPIPGSSNLLCAYGNTFLILDSRTGETIAQCGTGSGIQAVVAGEQSATAVLQDGYLCTYHYDDNYCHEVKAMENGVDSAVLGQNYYSLHWLEDHVTVYRNIAGIPAWESTSEYGFSVSKSAAQGSYLAFQDWSRQYLFDMESREFLWVLEKGRKEILGFSSDGRRLWYAEGTDAVTELDIATGLCETTDIELKDGERISLDRNFAFFDDCLYYTVRSDESVYLVCWNLGTGEKTSCTLQLDTEDSYVHWSWTIFQVKDQYVWLQAYGKMMLEADMRTGQTQIILPETVHRPAVAVHSRQNIAAIGHDGQILLKKPGQDPTTVITLDNANAGSMLFRDNMLLALCDNGYLYRFDLNGKLLGQTELWVNSQFASSLLSSYTDFSRLSWQFTDDNNLIINAFGEGNVIDIKTWTVKATLSNFLRYDPLSRCLVCKAGTALAGYTLYDTATLLDLAEQELNGFQMTPEQKISYGID